MPRAYSEDLRWRAIWLAEIVGLTVEEVSFCLQISVKTILRYVPKFQTAGNVQAEIIGRPSGCISFHPHEEFVIMDLILQSPEKTIAELVEEVLLQTESEYACSTLFYYLRRNNITRKKVCIESSDRNALHPAKKLQYSSLTSCMQLQTLCNNYFIKN